MYIQDNEQEIETVDIIRNNEKNKRKDRMVKHRKDRFEHDDNRWDGWA